MRRRRVLIIDDNENVLAILREFFHPAYAVDVVSSAADALKAMTAHTPDVILTDINMPGTDGLTLLASLRERGVGVPIFVITGYDSSEAAERARQHGAGYLVKPVDLRLLDRLIAEALNASPMLVG